MFLILLLAAVLLLPFLKTYLKNRKIAQCIDHLPGETKYPLIGTTWPAMRTSRETLFAYMGGRHQRFGPIYRSWLCSSPMVSFCKPEHVQVLFKSSDANYKGDCYKMLMPWLGHGLITGSGPTWKNHRKTITPAFHFKVLDAYNEIFAEKAELFAKHLEKYQGQGYFDITQDLTKIALDIIAESAMGVKLNYLQGDDRKGVEYANAIINFCSIVYRRVLNPIYKSDFTFGYTAMGKKSAQYNKIIQDFNNDIIQTRKRQFLNGERVVTLDDDNFGCKQKISFLDLLLTCEYAHSLSEKEIKDEVSTFMFGGFDTTTATVTYTMLALGNAPEIQKRVQEELDQIFFDDANRKVTPQDIAQMEYLDRVVKEVLRCHNLVPFLYRQLQDDLEIGGVKLPKGVNVAVSLHDLHHDPEHYPDPYKFDPDRFLPEACAQRHPYAYVPFSAGARNCLGQKFAMRNVKTILSYILRKYNVTCKEKPEDLKYVVEVVIRPQGGLHIALEPRKTRRNG